MRVVMLMALLLVLTACSRAEAPRREPEPLNDGRTQVLPLSGLNHYTAGFGDLSFELPGDVDYQPTGAEADGVQTWQAPAGENWCVVMAGSQPDFRGTFPGAAIASFAAGREPGGQIELNEPIDPVPGTTAGVRQRSRYPIVPGDLDSEPGVLFVRQFLTDDATLISLNVAGPASMIEACRLEEIAATLRAAS